MGLAVSNLDETRSRREFNKYLVPLPTIAGGFGNDALIIETAVMTPASPAVTKAVDSYLYRLCIDEGFHDVVSEYGLEPFELLANSIERTFVDKIFALCDYYLAGPIPLGNRGISTTSTSSHPSCPSTKPSLSFSIRCACSARVRMDASPHKTTWISRPSWKQ